VPGLPEIEIAARIHKIGLTIASPICGNGRRVPAYWRRVIPASSIPTRQSSRIRSATGYTTKPSRASRWEGCGWGYTTFPSPTRQRLSPRLASQTSCISARMSFIAGDVQRRQSDSRFFWLLRPTHRLPDIYIRRYNDFGAATALTDEPRVNLATRDLVRFRGRRGIAAAHSHTSGKLPEVFRYTG